MPELATQHSMEDAQADQEGFNALTPEERGQVVQDRVNAITAALNEIEDRQEHRIATLYAMFDILGGTFYHSAKAGADIDVMISQAVIEIMDTFKECAAHDNRTMQ